jgi:predicted Zn-dependent protease
VSPATRIRLLVVLAAVAAAAIVAGVVYATHQDPAQPVARCKTQFEPLFVPGVRTAHAAAVTAAFAGGPKKAARSLETLAQQNPADAVVQFNTGTALLCAGYPLEAAAAYRRAKKAGRDSYYEVQSDLLLHPQFFGKAGYPPFEYAGSDSLLVQGQIQQRAYHQHSAERLWARAARLRPNDDAAQVAAAVGRFDMDNLAASFSHLGPLVRRFPRSQTVRFHLGLLLVWTGQGDQAVKELRLARTLGPTSKLGQDAAKLLAGLVTSGTNRSKR